MTAQTLAEFLLARIAEDERIARDMESDTSWGNPYGSGTASEFEDRFDYRRMLAECEAKRRILDRYADCLARIWTTLGVDQAREYEDSVLPALAQPYADHPDYREEWTA